MVEGTPLLREHTGQNLYPGFESLRLRQYLFVRTGHMGDGPYLRYAMSLVSGCAGVADVARRGYATEPEQLTQGNKREPNVKVTRADKTSPSEGMNRCVRLTGGGCVL